MSGPSLLALEDLKAIPPWVPPTEFPDLRPFRRARIAVDVETKDPDLKDRGPGVRRGAKIVGIAVGVDAAPATLRWYFPIGHAGGGNLDREVVLRWARAELNAHEGEVVGAYLLYDLDFLAEVGVTFPKVKRFRDVAVAEPLIDEWRPSYSLGAIARHHLGEDKEEAELKLAAEALGVGSTDDEVKANIWQLPSGRAGRYAERDVDLPLRILPRQEKRLAAEGLLPLWDVESRLIPCLLAMRRRGIRVDLARAEEVRAKLVKERDRQLAKLRHLAGPRAELMAPETFVEALERDGIFVPKTAKTGKPSVTKQLLEQHASAPSAAAVLAGRRVETVINTFLDGHILGHAIRGRIHATFNQVKSDEGGTIARFSSQDPNLQNLPSRDEEIGPMVRSILVGEEGEVYEKQDQSQVEFRVLTSRAIGEGSDEAREAYRRDPKTDYHKMTAEMMGVDPEDKVKRRRVKNVNFSRVNGAGARTIAYMYMNGDLQAAEEFIAEYDRRLPFVRASLRDASYKAQKDGYSVTLLGRRQRFPFWEPSEYSGKRPAPLPKSAALREWGESIKRAGTHAAINRELQGGAADIMKATMADAWDGGAFVALGGAPLVTVHDELGLSNPMTPAALAASAELKRISETCLKLRVPLLVEVARGANWGECG